MHLVSYRGPGVAGGVSTGLQQVWEGYATTDDCWWYIDGTSINRLDRSAAAVTPMNVLDERILAGHYRYCNEFLWPLLHDMPQFARYYPADRECYHRFNAIVAQTLSSGSGTTSNVSFIQDYQLALLPALLRLEAGKRSVVFWHIPWPKKVSRQNIEPLMAIARSLLASQQIGFHIDEYAQNFMRFVRDNLPAYDVNMQQGFVFAQSGRRQTSEALEVSPRDPGYASSYVTRPLRPMSSQSASQGTAVKVCPLAIDSERWRAMSKEKLSDESRAKLLDVAVTTPFILSVDRADYTKGVKERLRAIDDLFCRYPEHKEELTFIQICGRTRPGMRAFDEYWQESQALADEINARWQTENWAPLKWVEQKLSPAELSKLYRTAEAMLITAGRDGLNLTAKEYVACQHGDAAGVLLLSTGTGVWQEFQSAAMGLDMTGSPGAVADTINRSLKLPLNERQMRMKILNSRLDAQSLSRWWQTLTTLPLIPGFTNPADSHPRKRAIAG